MLFSIKTGQLVGAHQENSRANNAETATKALANLGCVTDVKASRIKRLKVSETLRFDTFENTGVSVERIKQ